MSELFTKIVLRNDSTASWDAVADTVVLMKGEVGVEFNPEAAAEGSQVKLKIGDGVHTWAELPYFTGDVSAIADRLGVIESDYLKAADKTELTGAIATAKSEAVAEAVAHVLGEGVDEKYDTLLEVANWILADTTSSAELVAKVNTIEGDYLKGADKEELQGAIDDLAGRVTEAETELDGKVDKVEGSRLMTADEAQKLEKLVMDENGSVSISGTVAAGNVDGLADWITARAGTLKGLSENNLTDALLEKLNAVEGGAQQNVLEGVQFEGVDLTITDKKVNLNRQDVVKASDEITVAEDGTLGVGEVNVNKLIQGTGEFLILNGGSAAN